MKTNKPVVCKCERCSKPFKAYVEQEHPLCREYLIPYSEDK